MNWYWYRT